MSEFQDLVGKTLRFWFPASEILENYRPDWLFGMELDFYLPEHNLAIEVQGRQHYLFCPKFQKDSADFQAQRLRDRRKRKLCSQKGITLLAVRRFKGLESQLRKAVPGRKFPHLPPELREQITAYRRGVHDLIQNTWVAVKVKSNGDLIGVNRPSADFVRQSNTRSK